MGCPQPRARARRGEVAAAFAIVAGGIAVIAGLVNAEAHSPGSPEHAYWRRVAAAIREGGIHLR
jgi:hypothetical protein